MFFSVCIGHPLSVSSSSALYSYFIFVALSLCNLIKYIASRRNTSLVSWGGVLLSPSRIGICLFVDNQTGCCKIWSSHIRFAEHSGLLMLSCGSCMFSPDKLWCVTYQVIDLGWCWRKWWWLSQSSPGQWSEFFLTKTGVWSYIIDRMWRSGNHAL